MRSAMRARKLAAVAIFLAGTLIAQFANAQSASDDNFTVPSGSVDNRLDVLANDNLPGGATIFSVSVPDQGGQVRIDSKRKFLIYTPRPGFQGVENFNYLVIYRSFRISGASVHVVVGGANTPPVALDDSYSVEQGQTLNVDATQGVLANDSDADGDALQASLLSKPSNGDVNLHADGSFTYKPKGDFTGEDSFSYRADDGSGVSQPAFVTITVAPRNAPPIIDKIPDQFASVGVPFELDLAAFVSDSDGPSPLQFEAVVLPPGLTLSLEGVVSGVPTPDALGANTASFSVSDGSSVVQGSFKLTVRDERITDLRVELTAGPNPVAVGARASWSITLFNESNYQVDSATVSGRFTAEAPFNFDAPSDSGCVLQPGVVETRVDCQVASVPAGASATIALTGTGGGAGDVFGIVNAAMANTTDVDPSDNSAYTALSIAESVSGVPGQLLQDVDALAVAAGDLDGDGSDDLAVATGGSESVLVFLNIVDPANERKRMLATEPVRIGPAVPDNDIAVGDLDGDFDLDIVASGSTSTTARVYLNDGAGSFQPVTLDPVDASAVAIGDIDADGVADLAFAGQTQAVVYFGTGVPGAYSSAQALPGAAGVDLAVADLIGDSRAEIVLAGPGTAASVFTYSGTAFSLAQSLPTGSTTSVAAADFNGDGAIDLLFGKASIDDSSGLPSNLLYLNGVLSGGGFSLAGELGAAPTSAVADGDADGNGEQDVIVLNATGAHQIFLSSGAAGRLVRAPDQLAVAGGSGAAIGGFSVDNRPDLAIATAKGVGIFRSDGSGRFGVGDVTGPSIQLIGAASVQTMVGAPYIDQGATAMDIDDGDLTGRIEISNSVDTSLIGQYSVTYQVWDDSGNASDLVTRSVEVRPNQPQGGGGGGAFEAFWLLLLAAIPALGALVRIWSGGVVDGIMARASAVQRGELHVDHVQQE